MAIHQMNSKGQNPHRLHSYQIYNYRNIRNMRNQYYMIPGTTSVTAEPTRSTMPAPSWPRTAGSGRGASPEDYGICMTNSGGNDPYQNFIDTAFFKIVVA